MILPELITIIVLLALSFFFSGAETAITSVNEARIHDLKVQGNKRARVVDKLRHNKSKVINSILLGNTLVNIASSSIATLMLFKLWGNEGAIYSTFIMTFVILVIAEVLPKTFALHNPEKVALYSSFLVDLMVKVCSPLTSAIEKIVSLLLIILRLDKSREKRSAPETLRELISFHKSEDSDSKGYLNMLGSILDLTEDKVGSIMTHRMDIVAVNADLEVEEAITQILSAPHSRIPLWRGTSDNIIGIVHVKDLISLLRKHPSVKDISLAMTEPWFIPESTPLNVQLHNFQQRRKHLALIIDEYGDLKGLVTLEDILEEIVGEISDEYDPAAENDIVQIDANTYRISGKMAVRDINKDLLWSLPDEDSTTLGGMIIGILEYIPEEGEECKLLEFSFKILKVKDNKVEVVEVKRDPSLDNF